MDAHDQTHRRRRTRALGLVTAVLAAAGAITMTTAGAAHASPTPGSPATSCQTIDFEKATVTPLAKTAGVPGSVRYRLTVSGTKPFLNMTVSLQPLVYFRQPEFWGIEVIGCLPGIVLPATGPYTTTLDFTGPMGTCGVEVIGASTSQQFDLAGCLALARAK